nr:MAG TPA: Mannosyl-glycoprotein endo-beta-N-acetylglucosaminidase [Bacteriophage sp.]
MTRLKGALKVILILGACMVGITLTNIHESNARPFNREEPSPPDTVPSFYSKTPQEGLWEALIYYDIKHPEIVYSQALLETGHFKSKGCTRDNNLFGLYNSRKKRYCEFSHWAESVKAYKDWVQYRYKSPNDYYEFLQRIGYAEDPNYITKLKQIVKKHGNKVKQNASSGYNQQAGKRV